MVVVQPLGCVMVRTLGNFLNFTSSQFTATHERQLGEAVRKRGHNRRVIVSPRGSPCRGDLLCTFVNEKRDRQETRGEEVYSSRCLVWGHVPLEGR